MLTNQTPLVVKLAKSAEPIRRSGRERKSGRDNLMFNDEILEIYSHIKKLSFIRMLR